MFPTNLTQREREIIPLLLSGATRDELARHFSLSPETIKIHTKNIFTKFNAANLRDCFKLLNQYQQFFGLGGMGVQVHVIQADLEFTLSPDRQSYNLVRTIDALVIVGPLVQIERGYTHVPSNFRPVFECTKPFQLHSDIVADIKRYVVKFDEPIKSGERFTLIEKTFSEKEFDGKTGFDKIRIASPFSHRKMRYIFPKDDFPDKIECLAIVGMNAVEVEGMLYYRNGNEFIAEIDRFDVPFEFMVTWEYLSAKMD